MGGWNVPSFMLIGLKHICTECGLEFPPDVQADELRASESRRLSSISQTPELANLLGNDMLDKLLTYDVSKVIKYDVFSQCSRVQAAGHSEL